MLMAAGASAAPAQLAVVNPTLYEYEGGPVAPANMTYNAGGTVFFKFEVRGFKANADRKIDLAYRIEAVDPLGTPLTEPVTGAIKTELAPEDKDWLPSVRQSVPVPPLTVPGTFRILFSVKDDIAGTEAKGELPFRVRTREVPQSASLTVADFRFFRDESGREPLVTPLYRGGDSLWARFDIVGYKCGEKNQIKVQYGIAVLGPSGNTMYSEPNAATEDSASFYPKRYLPGSLSLSLKPKTTPGEYTIVVTVRDEVGGQTFEGKYPFRIE